MFSHLALSAFNAFTLTGRGDAEQVIGLYASATLLPTLGVEPLLGRNFAATEDRPGGEQVVLVSHRFWQRHFNGQPAILGQAITLDGRPRTIIGVLPEAAASFPLNQFDVWVPRPAEVPFLVPSQLNNGGFFFQAIARLRPGGFARAGARRDERDCQWLSGSRIPATSMRRRRSKWCRCSRMRSGEQRRSYLMLFGAVGCVLLIACANIANLLLARFAARRKEIAARFALGASRGDVVGQLVTESMLIAVLGGACRPAARHVGRQRHRHVWRRPDSARAGYRARSRGTGLHAAGDAADRFRDRTAAGAASVGRQRRRDAQGSQPRFHGDRPTTARRAADCGGVAVAGVADWRRAAVDQFRRLQRVEPGFQPEGIFIAQLVLPPQRYPREKLVAFYEQFYQRLSTMPGVTAAALTIACR